MPKKKQSDLGPVVAFQRKVKAVLKQVERYAAEGGDLEDDKANRKLEQSFFRARDRLYDAQRYLTETEQQDVEGPFLALRRAISDAIRTAPDARVARRNVLLAQLEQKKREQRAWRIENGLEDPPRYR